MFRHDECRPAKGAEMICGAIDPLMAGTREKLAEPKRCSWASAGGLPERHYHDREWGVPVHSERRLFEFLVLEGAQAGLSWSTILRKRVAYRRAFAGFDVRKVASFNSRSIERLLKNSEIVRNRFKIQSAVNNAKAAMALRR